MAKGKVKWFSNVKGYGFLQSEGVEGDIFVHYKSIDGNGYKTLKEAEEVEFELVTGEKGPQAAHVLRTKKKPEGEKAEQK
jgi:cold shock protein